MGRIRSLRIRTEVDAAKHAHNCRGNSRHRIQRGEKRLNVHNGGNWYHRYCLDCAREMVRRDMDALEALARKLDP